MSDQSSTRSSRQSTQSSLADSSSQIASSSRTEEPIASTSATSTKAPSSPSSTADVSTPGRHTRKRSASIEATSPKARSPSPSAERPSKTARAQSPQSSPLSPGSSSRGQKNISQANGSGSPGAASPTRARTLRRSAGASAPEDLSPTSKYARSAEKRPEGNDGADAASTSAAGETDVANSSADRPASPLSPSSSAIAPQSGDEANRQRLTAVQLQSRQGSERVAQRLNLAAEQERILQRPQHLGAIEEEDDDDDEDEDEDEGRANTSNNSTSSFLSLSATISRGAYHQCGTARRVKVYELKGEQWFDRGTGYCAGVYDEHEDAALLVARMEDACQKLILGAAEENVSQDADRSGDESQEREPYVLVVNENLDTDDLLLRTRVVRDDVYQRQQDTLVVWTEPDGKDMALSFQEAEGCQEVWEFLTEVQKHFLLSARGDGLEMDETEGMASGMLGVSGAGMTTEIDLVMSDGAPFALPLPRMDNLAIIDMTLKDAASRSIAAREKVAEWILRDDYLRKLVPVFHDCEDLEQLDELHRLCTIMFTIIMLNDNTLVERMLRDDVFLGIVGMLEYDPEFPRLKASYRDYLVHTAKYKQVVPIPDDNIMAKIHQTFRLQYLKDVILARTLDDSTFAVLNSLIFYHQADIVMFCTTSESFLSSLFQLFEQARNVSSEKKAEAIIFLQQLCAVGKQVQLPSRLALYRTLTEWGLLIVLEYALGRPETRLRNAAAEILTSIIEYDASGVRAHILEQNDKGMSPLLGKLASILHEEQGDLGLKTQITESLRILFDSGPDGSAGGPVLAQTLAAASAQAGGDAARKDDTERFLNWFYDGEVDHMFSPLRSLRRFKELEKHNGRPLLRVISAAQSALYNHLCELLTFVMIHHSFRSQYWVNSTELGTRVASLLFAREKHLRLAALRFFRACLAKGNQFTNRNFVKIELLGAILDVVEAESTRDNLVTSACLEFFEHIRKDNVKPLINHLMERDGERVRALAQHSAIGQYFAALVAQWEKSQDAAAGLSTTLNDQSNASVERSSMAIFAAERERRLRDLAKRGENRAAIFDAEEDNYFQDDEEELTAEELADATPILMSNGASDSLGSGLVAYTGEDDEDDEDKGQVTGNSDVSLPLLSEADEADQQLAEAPIVPSSGGMSANALAEAPSRTPSLASPSLSTASISSVEAAPPLLEASTSKRKKGGHEENGDDEDEDMMGRLAKRKSLATNNDERKPALTRGQAPPTSDQGKTASPTSGRRLSINLTTQSSEKLAQEAGATKEGDDGKAS